MIKTTCCYIYHEDEILMLLRNKKQNDINEGKWIGIGGHQEEGETIEQTALREIKEETGLSVSDLKLAGILHFKQKKVGDTNEQDVYIYTAQSETKVVSGCNEGELAWINKEEILSLKLWDGDEIFLREMMMNRYFDLTLEYNEEVIVKAILNNKKLDLGGHND